MLCTPMTLSRHIISLLCVATAVVAAVLTGIQLSEGAQVQLKLVVFCALCFLAGVGVLGFALQFFTKNAGHILNCIFFGFFAGIMATNFIADVASGTTFHSLSGYLISYGFMVFFFALPVVGLILLWRTEVKGTAGQCAAPNDGQATSLGNSAVTGGHHH